MRTLRKLFLIVALLPMTATAESPNVMKAMEFFTGSCWNGHFIGSEDTDVHCFRAMVNDQFVRDNHVVTSQRGTYGGETVFWWDAERERILYSYWDTVGGMSSGEMIPTSSGFESPEQEYRAPDGTKMMIRTRWLIHSSDRYTMESVKRAGDQETRMFAIEYQRAALQPCPGPLCEYGK